MSLRNEWKPDQKKLEDACFQLQIVREYLLSKKKMISVKRLEVALEKIKQVIFSA